MQHLRFDKTHNTYYNMGDMYKSVNISQDAYNQLHRIATQLKKPKAQVVEALVKDFGKQLNEREKAKLARFNEEMGAKVRSLTFSRKPKVSTDDIDADYAAVAKTDYT